MVAGITNPYPSFANGHIVTVTEWNAIMDNLHSYLNSSVKPAIDTLQAAPANPLTNKGDIMTHTGSAAVRMAVGSNDYVLTADSTQTNGIKWAAPSGGVPSGAIFLWSGSTASIPSGYVICDGANSTPDLRGMFVIGASADSSSNANGYGAKTALSQAAATTHTHTGGTLRVPIYRDTSGQPSQAGHDGSNASTLFADFSQTISGGGGSSVSASGATGASSAGAPAYYALAYIMKT